MTKAMKAMEKQNLIRKVTDDDEEVVYAIVVETRDKEQKDINFSKKNFVIYDKFTKKIRFRTKDSVNEESLTTLFEKYRSLITGREISKIFVRLSLDVGIPLSEGGGVYFIPKLCLTRIDSMERLLEGTTGTILRLGICDHDSYKEEMSGAIRNDLFGSVSRLDQEVSRLETKYGEGGISDKLVDRRVSQIRRVTAKSDLYQGIGFDASEIQEGAEKCLTRLRSIKRR